MKNAVIYICSWHRKPNLRGEDCSKPGNYVCDNPPAARRTPPSNLALRKHHELVRACLANRRGLKLNRRRASSLPPQAKAIVPLTPYDTEAELLWSILERLRVVRW